jgi:hypothetical protein
VHRAQVQAMQDHLCQILAHYVVYLGSQLTLPIATHVEQFILEAAAARWYKEGNFEWFTTPGDELEPKASPDISADLPTNLFDLLSDPYSGNPSLFDENACESVLGPLLPLGSLGSTSRISTGQPSYSTSSFGGIESLNAVTHNPPIPSNDQETLSVSKAALESFDRWDSKWGYSIAYGSIHSNGRSQRIEPNGYYPSPLGMANLNSGFVARGSWGGTCFWFTVTRY